MPKDKIGKKTRRALNTSNREVGSFIKLVREKKSTGTEFMARVDGIRGDGRFLVTPVTMEGPQMLAHLSSALRIKKGDTRKNIKVAIAINDDVLVDGDTIHGVFSKDEAELVRNLLHLNVDTLFERPAPKVQEEEEEEEEKPKKTKKRKTYRK